MTACPLLVRYYESIVEQRNLRLDFDVILTNPPFQDTVNRKKTPHKLWIDFTLTAFDRFLKAGGHYVQVSPSSFSSPSNKILRLMTKHKTLFLRFDTGHHFPDVGSSFSDYAIVKDENSGSKTRVSASKGEFEFQLDERVFYLPNNMSPTALKLHSKIMFKQSPKLEVEWDYVVCHNIRRFGDNPTLSINKSNSFSFPVFHTNKSVWWSSIEQNWAKELKVMWTRSGYTKPFFDSGSMGGTDMAYYVRVSNANEGANLVGILNSPVYRYIFKTAKWSGFGNEIVFRNLPFLDFSREWKDSEIFSHFKLTNEEVEHINETVG